MQYLTEIVILQMIMTVYRQNYIYINLINHACATFEQRIVDRLNHVLKMLLVLENTRG